MATVDAKVFEHHGKNDGTWNVKISIYHKGQTKYIDTEHFVSSRQLTKSFEIKDTVLISALNTKLDNYRTAIGSIGSRLDFFSAQDVKEYLLNNGKEVDFIQFAEEHIEWLKKESKKPGQKGKAKSASNLNTVKNSLMDFFGRKCASVREINEPMLHAYDSFLRSERKITRLNQFQRPITTTQKALGDASVHNYMRDLRLLFGACVKKYNISRLGIKNIEHNPFNGYSIVKAPKTPKRNIPAEKIKMLKDCPVEPEGRAELARDLFILSLYLCGINAVDLYYLKRENVVDGRLEYTRSKTEGRREDDAFISIKVVKEARPLLDKYIGKLPERYSTNGNLNHALSDGMKQLRRTLKWKEKVTFYWARHSFATIARNKCGIHKDDVAEALNHVDNGHKSTDIYIEKDWSVVDKVQKKVIYFLINGKKKKRKTSAKLKVKMRNPIPQNVEAMARELALKWIKNSFHNMDRMGIPDKVS